MSGPLAAAFHQLCAEIGALTEAFGTRVDVASLGVLDRGGEMPLSRPGRTSPNRSCRLMRAADGWVAVNLAREDDRDLLPAWLALADGAAPWTAVERAVRARPWRDLTSAAEVLGLPVSGVGEIREGSLEAARLRLAAPQGSAGRPLHVLDLSALWAGPLCGAVLAAAGARVTRVESVSRPDPMRWTTPGLFARLHGAKSEVRLDLSCAEGRAELDARIRAADVVISSARPRGLQSLGLDVEQLVAETAGLVWVAVTAYGWGGDSGLRVGFGDDTAAAGGLVGWSRTGAPSFLGDALADPLTGLAASVGALRAIADGGGVLVDAALARTAAGARAACDLKVAA